MIKHLETTKGKAINILMPWEEYPRPQLVRNAWLNLNGKWKFMAINKSEKFSSEIIVPYPIESLLSGVNKVFPKDTEYYYMKEFNVPSNFKGKNVILHFGAVDQITNVFVNEQYVGKNIGGYLPFCFDITLFLNEGINKIEVYVTDNLDKTIPYGKQSNKPGNIWYTNISGIWKTVWLEAVNSVEYIKDIKVTTDGNNVSMKFKGISEGSVIVNRNSYNIVNSTCNFRINNPKFWSPENPYLYDFKVKTEHDEVSSYFALRDICISKINGINRIILNGTPYFINGVLDQGYYSDGIYTASCLDEIKDDILKMKALGYNTLRKHIKIENELFYYLCDKLGMLVIQDMVNNGKVHFVKDTLLPNIGIKAYNDSLFFRKKKTKLNFLDQSKKSIEYLYNHPCIVCYTIYNEGWGQYKSNKLYKELKSLDNSRLFDSTSGWFNHKYSDFNSMHIYFRKLKIKAKDNKATIISEFGGYIFKALGHVANEQKAYGYKKCEGLEEYKTEYKKLYLEQVIPLISKGLCGAIYTQLSDVEDEVNGILTYDREIEKINAIDTAEIIEKIKEEMDLIK